MAKSQRLIFVGTSGFAAAILEALNNADLDISAIYTRPDQPAGRGMSMRESAVKTVAKKLGMEGIIRQPVNFKNEDEMIGLANLKPDFLIVASYGLILPQGVLDIPAIAPVNVHASLLPKYRGAAPIERAIMENWQPGSVTGVSIMRMEAGLDTGPVYAAASMPIAGETGDTLTEKLASLGGGLLVDTLPNIANGTLKSVPQNDSLATYAHKLDKRDGIIDWNMPAVAVHARIRAVTSRPGAKTVLHLPGQDIEITVLPGRIGEVAEAEPGTVKLHKKGIAIACGDNWYELGNLIPKGRKEMSAQAFGNGLRKQAGIIGKA